MDALSLIANVGTSLSAAMSAGGALLNERDRQKAATLHAELTEKLIAAQAQLSQVLSTVIEQQRHIPVLEQRIRHLEAERAEQHRYTLAKVGSLGEFFAYRLRAPAELVERIDEAPHFVCQPCFEAGKKVVLVGNGDGYWQCPVCKHGAQVEPETPVHYGARRSLRGFLGDD